MESETHGFSTREDWTKWFLDYNLVISDLNDANYALIRSELPADEWVARYEENSANVRAAYLHNEEMLERHIRWFTRTPGRWTREVADPLLATLFRYVTRVQDLGAAYEIADSLLVFYGPLGDEIALMKCYTIRAFSCGFLDAFHLADQAYADCERALVIYERYFMELTPEEQSMGLSIYDLEFDRLTNLIKLGKATPELLDQMIARHAASSRAAAYVLATDQGYDFNAALPDFDFYLGFGALCLAPGECTPAQRDAICQAAKRRQSRVEADPEASENYRVRSWLVYRMAQRLVGRYSDGDVLGELKRLVGPYTRHIFQGLNFSQHAIEAVEAIQLATETLTRGGEIEPEFYQEVQELFIHYLATRPYTTFVDYVCAGLNYCYILTALPHIKERQELLQALLRLTMFRQVQTAMHTIMVGDLALEILDSVIRLRPALLVGQLGTRSAEEVRAKREELRAFLYQGALLHDIGKLLCSSVINAQSHRLGDLEFQVLKFHPVTGGELLEHLPGLTVFRDIALGHQKSYDGRSGYPPEFDNASSPIKIFIDIITICDSLDAATDHLGRNYTTSKDFDTVLGELRAGRDTRYSGALVDLLDEDGDLRDKLRVILEDGRRKVYYDVHKMILSASSVHPGQDKTPEWLFDLGVRWPND